MASPRIRAAEPRRPNAPPSAPNRCVVLVPVGRYIEPKCEEGLRRLEERGYAVRRITGHSDIARGRSVMATEALAEGFEELMWIDSDVVFEADAVDRLRASGLPFVGGIYPLKGPRRLAMTLLEPEATLVFGQGGGLRELRHLATGFMLTHRSVYETIQKHHQLPRCRGDRPPGVVPYFLSVIVKEGDGEPSYLSEDFSFCWRAREAGIRIFADTTIRLFHVGSYEYGWEDAGREWRLDPSFKMTIKRRG